MVPPYTFRPFEPIDSTITPVVISPAGEAAGLMPAPPGILGGMSWAPPPAVVVPAGLTHPRQQVLTTWGAGQG